MVDRVKIMLTSSLITMQTLVVVADTVHAHVWGSKLGPRIPPQGPHVIIPNFVKIGQTVWL